MPEHYRVGLSQDNCLHGESSGVVEYHLLMITLSTKGNIILVHTFTQSDIHLFYFVWRSDALFKGTYSIEEGTEEVPLVLARPSNLRPPDAPI